MSLMSDETTYVPIAVSVDLKDEIRRIAKEERRSMSRQAAEFIELGLAEYQRRLQEQEAIRSGSTQIDAEALEANR